MRRFIFTLEVLGGECNHSDPYADGTDPPASIKHDVGGQTWGGPGLGFGMRWSRYIRNT